MHCRHTLASRARRLEPACIPTLQTYCSSSLEEPHMICWAFAVVLEAAHSVVPPPPRWARTLLLLLDGIHLVAKV